MSTDSAPRRPPESVVESLALLGERARALAGESPRTLLGIAGAPGAGKSTFATALALMLTDLGAVVLPMDGFHLSNRVLRDRGSEARKGAADTYDVAGFVDLLIRVRQSATTVYAPTYDRAHHEPIAGAVRIPLSARLVIAEGNYLLTSSDGWGEVAPLLDAIWYLDPGTPTRVARLDSRHRALGRAEGEALAQLAAVDAANSKLIQSTRNRANLIVQLSD